MEGLIRAGQARAIGAILAMNERTRESGLALTPSQARALVAAGRQALADAGRVEFGGGVQEKIIHAFYDSAYLTKANYFDALCQLTELFYLYKNETDDRIGDDALIRIMKEAFEGPCQGSLELLCGRELNQLARAVRLGPQEEEADEDAWP